jgi:hypothetical protein
MNKLFIAAALVVTSFAALADGATYEYPQNIPSNVSRAEVRAELARAFTDGVLVAGEQSYLAPAEGRALSRSEVRAALDNARRNNGLARGEFSFVAPAGAAAPMQLAGR